VLLPIDFLTRWKTNSALSSELTQMLNVFSGEGGGVLLLLLLLLLYCWGSFFSFCWGCVGGMGVGGLQKTFPFVGASLSWTQSWVRSCFCIQCEVVFTDLSDNSGVLSVVCVYLNYLMLCCVYMRIFMHTSPSVYLMLINHGVLWKWFFKVHLINE
jgi:hypothetical protein